MSNLTRQQRGALVYIQLYGPLSSPNLALRLETTAQGAAATASSLVRRGLAERIKVGGRVHYQKRTA